MFSVNNVDLLKESIEMPSEIREWAVCLAPGAFFMASSAKASPSSPQRHGSERRGRQQVPAFPLVMFLQQLSLWPSTDGLQGKRNAAPSLDMQTLLLTFPLRAKKKKIASFPTINNPMKTRTAEL